MLYEKLLANLFSCPECKGRMEEADRRDENDTLFIWYKCRRPDCRGQWLKKIPLMKEQAVGQGVSRRY
ncbi:MAG: hypothetical protein Q7T18_04700 [Sedimentisphaerales bacterium]|nr:hypothetical protein [Sedimentisphaerales bacterium]